MDYIKKLLSSFLDKRLFNHTHNTFYIKVSFIQELKNVLSALSFGRVDEKIRDKPVALHTMSPVKHAEQRLEPGWKQETSIQRGTNMAEEVHKQPPVKRYSVYRSLEVK